MGFVYVEGQEDDQKFIDHMNTVTKSLVDSKEGLQADLKKLKKRMKDFEGVDPDEYIRLKTKVKELEDKGKEGESELEKQLRIMREQHEAESKGLKETVALLDHSNKKLLVDDEINKALIAAKVKSSLIDAAAIIIKQDVSVIDKDGKRVAVVGDKSIKDHVEAWALSDVGKNFILADNNAGGNGGGNNNQKHSSDYDKYFDKKSGLYNVTKQVLLKKQNLDLYNKLQEKYK